MITSVAYRGYLIRSAGLTGSAGFTVQKDGCTICHASSVEDAKSKIDDLLKE